MKKIQLIKHKILMVLLLTIGTLSYAGMPLWTFTPLTATTLSLTPNDTATVQYTVTNQSSRVHTLSMQSIQGITQTTTGLGICGNPFVLRGRASCTLSLQVNGSQLTSAINDGPIVCEQGSTLQCYRPALNNILHISQVAVIAPVIDAVTPSSGPNSGGTGITITGRGFTGATSLTFGGMVATSLKVVSSSSVTAVTPAYVTTGAVDVMITTPGGSGTLMNGFTYLTTAVGQSAYGGTIACLNTGNNLIAATKDNSTGIVWGGSGIPTGATSITDGATNTANIVACLSNPLGPCGQNLGITTYAAGICSAYAVDSQGNSPCQSGNTCYDDWFLPAGNNSGLDGQLQCLYTNRTAIGGFASGAASFYWSSTEDSSTNAYSQIFDNGVQLSSPKTLPLLVRCVRTFTP